MRIEPYKRRNPRKTIVFVDGEGVYTDEYGTRLDPRSIPPNHRCFITWENARRLTVEGVGESLLWKGEHIRWSPFQKPNETEWRPALSDCYVLRAPVHESTELNCHELGRWRDWLYRHGAMPGTAGGSSLGLLKGTLRRPLWCSVGWDRKRIRQSAGGRITNGPGGPDAYTGELAHYDLQAAYANGIGTTRYGGRWTPERVTAPQWLNHLTTQGTPLLVHARVYVPKHAPYGPLHTFSVPPKLRKHRFHPFVRMLMSASGNDYPTGKHVQGWWPVEEIRVAQRMGCSVRILDVWKHVAPKESPFRHWLAAVNEGREMSGLAGLLAKVTGNALWGNFALDPTMYGRRTIRRYTSRKRRPQVVKLDSRTFTAVPAVDLAEIVAGRVRARLLDAMLACGDSLLCAHTDGLWATTGVPLGDEWRVKATAHRVELLTPQKLRYYPRGSSPVTVYSGVPIEQGAAAFDRDWEKYDAGHTDHDPEDMQVVRAALRRAEGATLEGLPDMLPHPV